MTELIGTTENQESNPYGHTVFGKKKTGSFIGRLATAKKRPRASCKPNNFSQRVYAALYLQTCIRPSGVAHIRR